MTFAKYTTLVILSLLLLGNDYSTPVYALSTALQETSDSQTVLIHFQPGTSEEDAQNFVNTINGELVSWIAPLYVATVIVPEGVQGVWNETTIGGASEDFPVTNVEADSWVYGTYEANDPDLSDSQRTYSQSLLNMSTAWDYTTGSPNTIIAVLDTGIASAHPEFAGRILDGYDFYNNDDDPEDDHGHGTHVSGTAAAAVNNGIGAAGLCGRCSILPLKVLNENNAGTWSGVASGIVYAADHNADVIVMSLGSTSGTQVVENAIQYALEHDVVIISAAGNANSNRNFYPAAYDGVIGVAATDRNDQRWVLSNYGGYVDVSAPGHVIYSTFNDLTNSYNGHVFMSGTSMATPHVGGLAGMIRSLSPSLSNSEVARIIEQSAVDLGEVGRDDQFGYGRIDPTAALAMTVPETAAGVLAGMAWIDADIDGGLGTNEVERVNDAVITLLNTTSGKTVATTTTDMNGRWRFDNLNPGIYRLAAKSGDIDLIPTTPKQMEVRLELDEQLLNHALGYVSELPARSAGDIYVSRNSNVVTLYWDGISDLLTGMVLERSSLGNTYEVIGQLSFEAESVGARSLTSYTDILPAHLGESTVLYRMQLLPGGTYVDVLTVDLVPQTAQLPPATVVLPPNGAIIFLPWVVR